MPEPTRLPPGTVAQTNLQLYAQLRQASWSTEDIEGAGRDYVLAQQLLSGQFRGNGKPFVDHFVGTASLVLACGERPDLVRAALLHNAYRHGMWRDGRPRATARRRREVRAATRPDIEQLVFAYHGFPWSEASVQELLARPGPLGRTERDLVVLRLANEVEDRLDLGLLHSQQVRKDVTGMIALAEGLGLPVLATGLRQVQAEEAAGHVEPGLVRPEHGVVLITPRSHRRRLGAWAYQEYLIWRRRLGAVLRRSGLRRPR